MTDEKSQLDEGRQRAEVVTEARSWIRTPYHHMGRVKSAGCDCYTLLLEVYRKIGLFTDDDEQAFYPRDWMLHACEDHYKFRIVRHAAQMVERFCSKTEMTSAGNIVLVRVAAKRGSLDVHGGIISKWPLVINAYPPCVMEVSALYHHAFAAGRLEFFSPWGKPNV